MGTLKKFRIAALPDSPPSPLACPRCAAPLAYRQTLINWTQPVERWDFLSCDSCGTFEYRHRTLTLRPAPADILDPSNLCFCREKPDRRQNANPRIDGPGRRVTDQRRDQFS